MAGDQSDELKQTTAIARRYDVAERDARNQARGRRGRLIKVKTTNGWERTPFHITRNGRAVA